MATNTVAQKSVELAPDDYDRMVGDQVPAECRSCLVVEMMRVLPLRAEDRNGELSSIRGEIRACQLPQCDGRVKCCKAVQAWNVIPGADGIAPCGN